MSVPAALLPLLVLLGSFALGNAYIEESSSLLLACVCLAAAVACLQALRSGRSWDELQAEVGRRLAEVLPALLILLTIGALIGTWMAAGTIPMLVLVGLELVSPQQLALTAFLATATMSLVTGTSFGSAGTIGVALMGVAAVQGASMPLVAGAVLSGAYFGDKMSPLSDTTNVCAIAARTELYTHIKNMLFTAGPSFVVAALLYALWPAELADGDTSSASSSMIDALNFAFVGAFPVALPPALLLLGIATRKPAMPVMLASSFVAIIVALSSQGLAPQHALASFVSGFDASFVMGNHPIPEDFARLVNRGGLYSMAPTLVVVFAAFVLTAGMHLSGALEVIVRALQSAARGIFGTVAATMVSGSMMVGLTSHGMVTALVVGDLFRERYAEQGLAPQMLSRSLEDSVTIVEPLMPWTVSALYMATTLGVPTLEYMPFAFFCWTGSAFSLLWAALPGVWGRAVPRVDGPIV
jgi:NhaC family Na+:H+ antiporter